ncbi:hypothetical protein TwortDSMZ_208 [Staphylococcus phage Twort]|uniref:Uncharacterized protein n=2 Tax=Staphylococcus phage Twort (strain DSM 17442 / HER 48) TaxID=2908167 RepID=A0A6H0X5J9_BPTWO|nr:ORF192 [Staphylococcus phage Twort]AAX92456.1 ORF192 [Staphylococcus phage Twort]QIW89029.1 hypothetical protein TwortDSMZ_019 [Staphylococcus phage Twort]QIW89200.1 hypothetical protein TwortDSMZ_208 [Staphylococcus phage Twort]
MKQAQAIKKFIELRKELKEEGYTISKQQLLSNMEIYHLNLKIDSQIEWFLETPNNEIIEEMKDLGDL